MGKPTARRILIVEDNPALRRSLEEALLARAPTVVACGTVTEARELLARVRPDLLVLDVALPDGDAFDVLTAAQALEVAPVVVAMSGEAGPDQSFLLAQRGVRAYVRKPFALDALDRALDVALTTAPDLAPLVRAAVGHMPVRDVERDVRRTMVTEALARSGGSKNGAAKLLRISRQLLQHIVRAAAE